MEQELSICDEVFDTNRYNSCKQAHSNRQKQCKEQGGQSSCLREAAAYNEFCTRKELGGTFLVTTGQSCATRYESLQRQC